MRQRRAIVFENTDFYGGDIRTITDTTLDIAAQACLDTPTCQALTFNQTKGAAFLKSTANERSFFDGALSMQIINAAPALLATARTRADDLAFLPEGAVTRATRLATQIGRKYPLNDIDATRLDLRFQAAITNEEFATALGLAARRLSLEDLADTWLSVATLATKLAKTAPERRFTLRSMARDAAVNAYLRSTDNAERANAMVLLAQLLQANRQGRVSIDALRLAHSLDGRESIVAALDHAIGRYGFRVTDYQVDNNAARPRICLNFSEPLRELGIDYASFLRISSGALPVEPDGDQLCIDGVTHGQSYEIALREGLPAASGEVLASSTTVTAYGRDRDPVVRFIGRSYVLPASAAPAIPVVTVNADEVELKLFRVGERNLVPTVMAGIVGQALDNYDESALADQRGTEVWRGIGEVGNTLNANVVTALPLAEALQSFQPGIYVMTARIAGSAQPWGQAATQWFIVTDLGIETLLGSDGLHVFARSLRSATPLGGISARLLASNNNVLFETTTDTAGHALIPPGYTVGTGGDSPAMLQLQSQAGDFAFIDLNQAAMDLSDRGVSGRPAPEKIDIFASFERGAYRPGETVFATILARDASAAATPGLPLTAVLYRPDGVEHSRSLLADAGAGGRVFAQTLPAAAMRGTWRLEILADPAAPSLKSMRFLVEDFTPERIDFTLDLPGGAITPALPPTLTIAANYLYGAPAAGLAIEGETTLTTSQSIAAYPAYRFGLFDEPFNETYAPIETSARTDSDGKLSFGLTLPPLTPGTRPLEMRATLRLSDGSGRPVERTITRALLPDGPRIGIKPLFEGTLREGSEASFDIIAIDSQTRRTTMQNVSWALSRGERNYQWYRYDGRWNWEPVTRRIRVAAGTLALTAGTSARINSAVGWGRYELKIVNTDGQYTASSYAFTAGWWSAEASVDTPDVLDVSLDKARYRVGGTARLRITPRQAGTVLVRVVSDRLISMQALAVEPGEQVVDVPVAEDWGAGAYIIATLIQPMDTAKNRNPARAIGLAYAPTDPGIRQLSARFDMPPVVRPRGPLDVRLKVGGGEGPVYATIAAVDLGILNLTGFTSPDPAQYYFGQRRLGVELRDIYGRLIDGMQGTPGRLRSGGDGALARVNAPPPTQALVAYFSGPLTVGTDGYASASFDLPAYNGTVRLMAVVWSGTAVGQAEYDLLVRDPVVVSAAMPRFLAPGDSTRLRVDLANVSAPAGKFSVTLSGNGGVSGQTYIVPPSVILAEGGQGSLNFPITAGAAGDYTLVLTVTAPDGAQYRQSLPVSVRANDPLINRALAAALPGKGGSFSIDPAVFTEMQPGSGTGNYTLGPLARFDVAGMLDALDRTPWGGTETRVSRAMPLLYLADIASVMDLNGTADPADRVRKAIIQVLANQTSTGAFGQWAPESGDFWLDAFATDFLSRARVAGYAVSARAFSQALENLRNQLNYAGDFDNAGQGIAYALMVLAREGKASIGDLRYYADVKTYDFATPMALAQLGAALAYNGDQTRADRLFAKAYARVQGFTGEDQSYRDDYGTQRRDSAALLALATEAGSQAIDRNALAARITTPKRYYSAQERLWQLLAARALIVADAADISVDGTLLAAPQIVRFDAQALQLSPIVVQNNGAVAVNGLLNVIGAPAYDPPAQSSGYRMERWLYTLEGDPTDMAAITQNQRYVAILRVTPEQERRGRLIVSDPLPAGFEIDNPGLLRAGDISRLDWLQLDETYAQTEFRTDRFLAALTWGKKGSFQLAYIVRAVSPGQFRQPAALVEDMYRPNLRATTGVNMITILPAD